MQVIVVLILSYVVKESRFLSLELGRHGHKKDIHPFYVKSNWNPPVQQSVALESYLEEVKMQLAVTKIIKPKHNLSRNERKALNELKHHTEINLKKADKGSTTVVMNKNDKIREGQIQIDDQNKILQSSRTTHGQRDTQQSVTSHFRTAPW